MIFLEITSSPSSHDITPSSLIRSILSSGIANVISESPYSHPDLIKSGDVLLPNAALIEPRIIDLPAPVSPESILSPSSKSIFSSSINARFLTCKLTNIPCLSILSINYS